jgi:hypothetical protein
MSDHLNDTFLNEYLDGYLSASQIIDVETHLATCAGCAARAESLRALFTTLDDLPDLPLNKDFSKAVLRTLRPEVILPRPWKWAVWGQLALAALLIAVSLPTFLQMEWLARLPQIPEFAEPLSQLGPAFEQFTQTIRQSMSQWLESFATFQAPSLPVSLGVLTPILLATGLLWLVGNGLLLKKRI